jgi:AraC-like DNA-binding protein
MPKFAPDHIEARDEPMTAPSPMTAAPRATRERMVELIGRLAPSEGQTQSALDGVRFMRSNRPHTKAPALYEPCIGILVQGCKRIQLGDQVYVWDAQHYLVLSVPLPFTAETEASEKEPLLGISLRIDQVQVAELALALDERERRTGAVPKAMTSTPLDARLSDALLRLLEALTSPLETKILGPSILREIFLRMLTGEQGPAMRAALTHGGQFGKIAKALRRIHAEYDGDLDVGMLARDAGMSVPVFHTHFKTVTTTSPIQYVKATRLHQARLLMARDGVTAASAAAKVGYESPSQFSREFKRMFGRSPTDEAEQMRQYLAVMPAGNPAPSASAA